MGYNKSKRIALALRDIQNKEELKTLPRIPFGGKYNSLSIVDHPVGGKFVLKHVYGYVGDTDHSDIHGKVRQRYKHELLRSSLHNLLGIDGPQVHYLDSEQHPDNTETHHLAIEHLPEGTKPLSLHPEILYSNLHDDAISDVVSRTNPDQLQKLTLLDWILDAKDRHLNNYMISPDDKMLYSIDHEVTGPDNTEVVNPPHSIAAYYMFKNKHKKFDKHIIDHFIKHKSAILSEVHKHMFSILSPDTLKKYLGDISKKIDFLGENITYGDLASLYKNNAVNMKDQTEKV